MANPACYSLINFLLVGSFVSFRLYLIYSRGERDVVKGNYGVETGAERKSLNRGIQM